MTGSGDPVAGRSAGASGRPSAAAAAEPAWVRTTVVCRRWKSAPERGWVSTGAGMTPASVGFTEAEAGAGTAWAAPGTAATGRPRAAATTSSRDADNLRTVPASRDTTLEHPTLHKSISISKDACRIRGRRSTQFRRDGRPSGRPHWYVTWQLHRG